MPRIQFAPGIAITRASIRFDHRLVADGLEINIAGGRTTCLLGPSGVGKTSLLKLIAGTLRSAATATIASSDGQPLQGRIAYMAQQDLLLPWLTVLDNVCLGFRVRADPAGYRSARSRAQDLLAEMGLQSWTTALPAQLSGGMRQRVALARTLIEDRPVVLMDEPFGQLDIVTRLELQELASRSLQGRTVILVTHDPLEALRLGHAVHVMSGLPVALGSAIEPAGAPPRAVDDPEIITLQTKLLRQLVDAHAGLRSAA